MRKSNKHKAFIVHKGYGKTAKLIYYPLDEAQEIETEPLTLRRIMKQTEVELLKPVEFNTAFGVKSFPVGIHSIDSDLANLLVKVNSARYILPRKTVLAAKESRH